MRIKPYPLKLFRLTASLIIMLTLTAQTVSQARSQDITPETPPPATQEALAQPPSRKLIDHDVIELQLLDKVTARTSTFDVKVGTTVRFGTLYITTKSCRKSPPIEQPEAAGFLQIWEVKPDEESEWVFSGWMFASSRALSAMDHPIYDVWVIDCKNDVTTQESSTVEESTPEL